MYKNSIKERWYSGYKHNSRMEEVTKKYRFADVEKEILFDGMTRNEASKKEIEMIKKYNSTDETIGYNVSHGGVKTFAGLHHTEEHKKYISKLYKGKEFSAEHIQHLIDAHKNERHKVIAIDKCGNVFEYESMTEAGKVFGCCTTTISRVCKRKGFYKGMQFSLAE